MRSPSAFERQRRLERLLRERQIKRTLAWVRWGCGLLLVAIWLLTMRS